MAVENKRSLEESEDEAKAARKAARKEAKKAARKAEKKAAKEAAANNEGSNAASPSAPSVKAAPRFDKFADAPFAEPVRKALEAKYPSPTDIQSQAWPAALTGNDLIAVAKTGSGKTLAFVLPLLHRLSSSSGKVGVVRGLVLSPTRELASQIHVEAELFGKLMGQPTMVVYGGTPLREQKQALTSTRPSVVVATPGRLVDLLEQGALSLASCDAIVLDEADRLLDMGFKPQLEATYKAMPASRQTLLFTATWPKAVRKLAASYLRDEETTTLFLSGSGAGGQADGGGETSANGAGGAADGHDDCELSANLSLIHI